mmetsp:Transcript_44611/g.123636  ORF Transcript_44611/g.123636 Transcript_44611/m.123636 type:complete len:262 (-) Transcript_44611:147-932(-)
MVKRPKGRLNGPFASRRKASGSSNPRIRSGYRPRPRILKSTVVSVAASYSVKTRCTRASSRAPPSSDTAIGDGSYSMTLAMVPATGSISCPIRRKLAKGPVGMPIMSGASVYSSVHLPPSSAVGCVLGFMAASALMSLVTSALSDSVAVKPRFKGPMAVNSALRAVSRSTFKRSSGARTNGRGSSNSVPGAPGTVRKTAAGKSDSTPAAAERGTSAESPTPRNVRPLRSPWDAKGSAFAKLRSEGLARSRMHSGAPSKAQT